MKVQLRRRGGDEAAGPAAVTRSTSTLTGDEGNAADRFRLV
ncbi:hypothetical protein [Streptosporangium sp. NPDC049046]